MNDQRKKPGVAFWATVTLVSVVVYVLSYGPWMAFSVHVLQSPASIDGWGLYAPLYWIANGNGPTWISVPYNAYLKWWLFAGT